MVMSI